VTARKDDFAAIDTPDHPDLTPVLHWMSNLMCLWGLCAKPACRRARKCRGEPRDCLARYAPLVPEEAREGIKAMIEGRRDNLSFDEVRDMADGEVDAAIEWMALVAQSAAAGENG
jgi:hypothetical protein